MKPTLHENDVQKMISGVAASFNIEKATELFATGKYDAASPQDIINLSASKMTDKDGVEKFVFVVDKIGTIVMAPDESLLYHVERLEGNHQNAIWLIFETAVEFYAGIKWREK